MMASQGSPGKGPPPLRTRLAWRVALLVVAVTLATGLLTLLGAQRLARGTASPPLAGALATHRIELLGLALALGLVLALTLHWALVRPITDLAWRLSQDQRRNQTLLNHAGTGIFVVRGDGTLETWTPAFLLLLGQGPAPPDPDVPFHLLFGPASIQAEICLRACQTEKARQVAILRLPEGDGQRHRWLRLTLEVIGPDWIQGQLEDITSFRDEALAAEELAIRDPLTGAINRLGAERALQDRLAPGRGPLAVMLVDLDRFKLVNDTYGHAVGDEVLREVVVRMKAALRHSDVLARLGGDEFLIVLDAIQTEDAARSIAQNLIRTLNQPIPVAGPEPVRIGASVGIAFGGGPEPLPRATLLKRADLAMYEAKKAGRNRCRFYQA